MRNLITTITLVTLVALSIASAHALQCRTICGSNSGCGAGANCSGSSCTTYCN